MARTQRRFEHCHPHRYLNLFFRQVNMTEAQLRHLARVTSMNAFNSKPALYCFNSNRVIGSPFNQFHLFLYSLSYSDHYSIMKILPVLQHHAWVASVACLFHLTHKQSCTFKRQTYTQGTDKETRARDETLQSVAVLRFPYTLLGQIPSTTLHSPSKLPQWCKTDGSGLCSEALTCFARSTISLTHLKSCGNKTGEV